MSITPKTIFTCSHCDAQLPKWSGRCPECNKWGTIQEGITETKKNTSPTPKFDALMVKSFSNIKDNYLPRLIIGINEIDRLLGGGIVPGSLILLGGEPGIGKSTLALQIFKSLKEKNLLYVSGEESLAQIKLRADRLQYQGKNLKLINETNVEKIISAIENLAPDLVIIDSIQTVYSWEEESESGSVSQIRATTAKLLNVAKEKNIPIIITGHVTKDGAVAGPKTLEHLVDVVLYLEGDRYHGYRLLRSVKNRFGSTNDLGIFEMSGEGLNEISDPANIFLQSHNEATPGSVISCFTEASRAFLIEIQALVTPTVFGYPLRKASGFDSNRLQMLSAVISKRANVNLGNQDIHLNIVGGFKVNEPGVDLAVCAAIISAMKNRTIPKDTMICGEVGLNGDLRHVSNLEKRLTEAEKLNFKTAIIPQTNLNKKFKLELKSLKNLTDFNNLLK